MIVRHFRRFVVSALVAAGVIPLPALAARVAHGNQKKFERDLQSLLGAVVHTKNGDMLLRQHTDDQGRIRKQIVVGPEFQEIQLDQDADGTVDFWEITRGKKTVEFSHPNRGRFLRLVVTDRFAEGMQQSTYLLNLNSRAYTLLTTKFTGKGVSYKSETTTGDTFEAVDSPATVPSTLSLSSVPVASTIGASADRFPLSENDQWRARQIEVLGGEVCSEDTTMSRLAELQRSWWEVLNKKSDQKADRLATLLKSSPMFDSSCKTPAADFDKITKSLATVMMSSTKGTAPPSDNTRGRFMRCLEQSGLGVTAAKMETAFLNFYSNRQVNTPFVCEWKKGSGKTIPLEAFPTDQQIRVYMPGAEEGTGKNKDGALQNYQNTIFHEMIHIGGIVDEDIAHAAEACCGDPTDSRVTACGNLDALVAREKRYIDIQTHLERGGDGGSSLITALETQFGAETANKMSREFLMGLDTQRDSEFPNGLLNDADFAICSKLSGEAACRAKWEKAVRSYADKFFGKTCRDIAPGAMRKNCKNISSAARDEIAQTVAKSLIDSPRDYGTDPTGLSGAPVRCDKKMKASTETDGANSAIASLLRFVFGSNVAAVDPDECDGAIGIPSSGTTAGTNPPVVAPPAGEVAPVQSDRSYGVGGEVGLRSITVPGQASTGETSGTSGRTNDSIGGGSTKPPRTPSRSPLPVTRIDSESGARSFAEDRYRRATDFVGSASRGIERVRDALLPAAVAATLSETASGRARGRLAPDAEFVAFKPKKGDELLVKLDNPFSAKRGPASVTGAVSSGNSGGAAGTGGSLSSLGAGGASASSLSSFKSGADNARTGAGTSEDDRDVTQNRRGGKRKLASAADGSGGAAGSVAGGVATGKLDPGSSKLTGKDKLGKDDSGLSSMFVLPYRQIEPRLNQLATVEMLISSKISVRDARNHLIGASRPTTCYEFTHMDRPLRRLSMCGEP